MRLPAFPKRTLERVDTSLYPRLFAENDWGPVRAEFRLHIDRAPPRLLAAANAVIKTGGRWIVVQLPNGRWTVPGGTCEPGEPLLDALKREAMEEAGAELRGARFFGSWRCVSKCREPHRPHVPHPVFYRAVAAAHAEAVGPPLNPADGEQIAETRRLPIREAAETLRQSGRNDLAELYLLADTLLGRL